MFYILEGKYVMIDVTGTPHEDPGAALYAEKATAMIIPSHQIWVSTKSIQDGTMHGMVSCYYTSKAIAIYFYLKTSTQVTKYLLQILIKNDQQRASRCRGLPHIQLGIGPPPSLPDRK